MRQIALAQHATRAGSLDIQSYNCRVRIPTRRSDKAKEYLQQHFDRDISIDILARQAGMGPRNFIRRFKAATGRVPGAYLQTLRVSAAKEML
ncbi:MAG: AraC family transcriptional regulator [Pseudolabrys sp.]